MLSIREPVSCKSESFFICLICCQISDSRQILKHSPCTLRYGGRSMSIVLTILTVYETKRTTFQF